MKRQAPRTARLSLCMLVAVLACFVVPASASAETATVRIEGFGTTLVPATAVTLPTTPVAPAGASGDQTCAGGTVIGAVDAATGHAWNGTWDATNSVWSLDTIKGNNALVSDGRKWEVLINGVLSNDSPCTATVKASDVVTVWPQCLGSTTTKCYSQGPLEIYGPSIGSPGAGIHMTIYEYKVTVDANGIGSVQRGPSLAANVFGPDGSTTSDSYYGTGQAILTIAEKGPATISAAKANHAPNTLPVCITDGQDGYCGTTVPTPTPFDPYAFCSGDTNGHDGYCGTTDTTSPVGRITLPGQDAKYAAKSGPAKLTGTVDFDPSQTDHVDLRLVRRIQITVKKLQKTRKVWVTKKVHGKKVRKRVTKKIYKKVKQTACYAWSDAASAWNRMKTCDPSTAKSFRATGAEVWSYDFLEKLPSGAYTLDALATDGSNNVDSTPELGRNRVTFTVA